MRRAFLTLLTLVLASLACALPVATPIPNVTTLPTHTPNATDTALPTQTDTPNSWVANVRLPVVTVRDAPDGEPTGDYLTSGNTVVILRCVDDPEIGEWCRIKSPAGWVFRGCLSDNPKKLGCEAK